MDIELPKTVREIADVIGRPQALRLIGQLPTCFAGVEGKKSTRVILYVPKRISPSHKLVHILGWHDANKMVKHFGGEILYPANCRSIYARYRDNTVLKMIEDGIPPKAIEAVMSLSMSHIRYIVQRAQKKPHNDKANGVLQSA